MRLNSRLKNRLSKTTTLSSVILLALLLVQGCQPKEASQTGAPSAESSTTGVCKVAMNAAEQQMQLFSSTYTDPQRIPRSFNDGETRFVGPEDWTSGFVAGSYWYLFDYTRSEKWRSLAEKWTQALEAQKHNKGTHDLGFMLFNSFGLGAQMTSNQNYDQVLIETADSLMSRYDPKVGLIRSWDFGEWQYPVIIDNMMNLELLYYVAKLTDDESYAEAASSHATKTMMHHFRDDESSFHVVDYDPATGEVLAKQTHQGIDDESQWARGQAWGVYGFTMAYRFTENPAYLRRAQKIADYYLSHANMPDDGIPYFDFSVVDYPEVERYRDSSAAAITASALFELSQYVPANQADRYQKAAMAMLEVLSSPTYSAKGEENGFFLLKQATGHWPARDELSGALNYADYYYLEALNRCLSL